MQETLVCLMTAAGESEVAFEIGQWVSYDLSQQFLDVPSLSLALTARMPLLVIIDRDQNMEK